MSREPIVKLNVGGRLFATNEHVLRRDNFAPSVFFDSLQSPQYGKQELDGVRFFDRSPARFELILDYLRDGPEQTVFLWSRTTCEAMLVEARYYRLQRLEAMLEWRLGPSIP